MTFHLALLSVSAGGNRVAQRLCVACVTLLLDVFQSCRGYLENTENPGGIEGDFWMVGLKRRVVCVKNLSGTCLRQSNSLT